MTPAASGESMHPTLVPLRPGSEDGRRESVSLEDIEIASFLEALYRRYGHDFRGYAMSSLRRRLRHRVELEGVRSVSDLQHEVLRNPGLLDRVLLDLSINTTEFFRDPYFFLALREKIIPLMKTYPFARVWVAGCSSGEEIYSLAIVFREEGLASRMRIYATDFNEVILRRAREGIYRDDGLEAAEQGYRLAGGRRRFSDYVKRLEDDRFAVDEALRGNVVFSSHNLVTDGVFAETHLVLCRNVLIYFDRQLQSRALRLFFESLLPGGVLCIGTKESLRFNESEDRAEPIDERQRIFRKTAGMEIESPRDRSASSDVDAAERGAERGADVD